MPSNYDAVRVIKSDGNGNVEQIAGATVVAQRADTNVDLQTFTTDENGEIAAGSFNIPAGTRVRFRVQNYQGLAGSISQITI
jgi:hypothetical protein